MDVTHLGVIGGSGLYRFMDDAHEVRVSTPWGDPSAPLTVGRVGGREVAFLPRHGLDHELPPHRINFRANLWALRELGVSRVFAPCASGSLQPDIVPGDFVVCDGLVDRTTGRADTYFEGPVVNHVSFADPYCPELSAVAVAAGRAQGVRVHDGGTVVVVSGPRFSTRAESRWFAGNGWHVVNMTQHPEAVLARELGLCYSSIALITDFDAGVEHDPSVGPVTQAEVFALIDANAERVRSLLFSALEQVPLERACGCQAASNGLDPVPPTA